MNILVSHQIKECTSRMSGLPCYLAIFGTTSWGFFSPRTGSVLFGNASGGINLLFPLSLVMKGVSLGFNLCDHSHTHNHCVGHYPMQFHLLLIYILGPPFFFTFFFHTPFISGCSSSFWNKALYK